MSLNPFISLEGFGSRAKFTPYRSFLFNFALCYVKIFFYKFFFLLPILGLVTYSLRSWLAGPATQATGQVDWRRGGLSRDHDRGSRCWRLDGPTGFGGARRGDGRLKIFFFPPRVPRRGGPGAGAGRGPPPLSARSREGVRRARARDACESLRTGRRAALLPLRAGGGSKCRTFNG